LKNTPIVLDRHQEAATQIQKAWKELNKSKIPKFKEERSKKLAKEANNLMRNILRMNNLPKTSILGKRRNTEDRKSVV
jgi:bacterioferritin (cytochrome b1)